MLIQLLLFCRLPSSGMITREPLLTLSRSCQNRASRVSCSHIRQTSTRMVSFTGSEQMPGKFMSYVMTWLLLRY